MSLKPEDQDLPRVIVENGRVYRVKLDEVDIARLLKDHDRVSQAAIRLGAENARLRSEAARYPATKAALDKLVEFTIALGEGRVSLPGVNDPSNMTQGIVQAIVDPDQYRGGGHPVDPLKRFGVEIRPAALLPIGRAKRSDA